MEESSTTYPPMLESGNYPYKKYFDTKLVGKVLRSLLERFLIKVIVIKKAKGLESLKIDELIESLMSLDEAKRRKIKDERNIS
ncbi:hypothetical protein Gorai_008778, partial [Gossypium raimondii]|nr:hypothetical protein [Gossypium raimondii]